MKYNKPDQKGHFEIFGGKYVPETLLPAIKQLEDIYLNLIKEKSFQNQVSELLKNFSGRPTPLYYSKRISNELNCEIYLKREDLNHTGAHKINNAVGQILLANKMNKKRIIAETGAGQHGVATATVAAHFGLQCCIYMGEEDIRRQKLNVFKMKLLGAEVIPVLSGSRTLKDATNEAIRDWVTNVEDTYYLIGSVVGPHPYPMIVRDFQKIIGNEVMEQFSEYHPNKNPDTIIACIGGGSNAMGIFYPFIDKNVRLIGVEAAGKGIDTEQHASTMNKGEYGILHGSASFLLQNKDGQVKLPYSISAGLDYPGIGPEHAYLKSINRVKYYSITDQQAVNAFMWLSKMEGIIPALETSHALAFLKYNSNIIKKNEKVVVCLSGRGDKDVYTISDYLNKKNE